MTLRRQEDEQLLARLDERSAFMVETIADLKRAQADLASAQADVASAVGEVKAETLKARSETAGVAAEMKQLQERERERNGGMLDLLRWRDKHMGEYTLLASTVATDGEEARARLYEAEGNIVALQAIQHDGKIAADTKKKVWHTQAQVLQKLFEITTSATVLGFIFWLFRQLGL